MPPFYRIVEVSVYSILNFLPHLLIALYTFKNKLRFNKSVTVLLLTGVTVTQILTGCLAAFSLIDNSVLSFLSTMTYALFYVIAVKAHLGKIFFNLLLLSNMANFVVIASKCIEGIIFGPDLAVQAYRYSYSICMVMVHLLTTLPLFIYSKKYIYTVMNIDTVKSIWNYAWIIPATFYVIWFHHIYGSNKSSLEISLDVDHTVLLLFIDLGSLVIYHMVINVINSQNKTIELEKSNYQLAMNNIQYENLKEKINEARQAKHDIRHHITIIDSYLNSKEYDKLSKYIQSYKRSLPDDTSIVFCKHYAINTLLLYFAQQSKKNMIDFDVVVADIPEHINIPDDVLSVVLGNLLENAIEACQQVPESSRFIVIKGKAADGNIFFKIDNSYNGIIKKAANGLYMSTKHSGRGIGLQSVRSIIKQYDGIIEIEHTDKTFSVSVFSNIPE